jgi:hypothetical protein
MNEHLKFSWGHIIAFLALIAIGYFSFVGVTYMTEGSFGVAAIAMAAIVVVLAAIFVGAQWLKATPKKFKRRIKIERACIFSSPVVFLLLMMPYFHFGGVYKNNDEIVNDFNNAIKASTQMFADYDIYAEKRIAKFENSLDDEYNSIQKENMVRTLRLVLLSENYDSLKTEATKWIESSCEGVSTFNVFLLGNTKEIKTAIHDWNNQLISFSKKTLSNEWTADGFFKSSNSLANVDKGLDGLAEKFTRASFPPVGFIIGAIVLYFALLFPYFLQDRHTKSQFRLIGMEDGASGVPSLDIGPSPETSSEEEEIHIDMPSTPPPSNEDAESDDDWGPIIIEDANKNRNNQ